MSRAGKRPVSFISRRRLNGSVWLTASQSSPLALNSPDSPRGESEATGEPPLSLRRSPVVSEPRRAVPAGKHMALWRIDGACICLLRGATTLSDCLGLAYFA